MLLSLLLQLGEAVGQAAKATESVHKVVDQEGGLAVVFFWSTIVLLIVVVVSGVYFVRYLTQFPEKLEAACKMKLEGYAKSELELKSKHATEIALNESNHQSMVRTLEKALSDANDERRGLHGKINSMAGDMAELFDTFSDKINTFAELQASQIAGIQTIKAEILLEITRLFSRR